MEEFYKHAKIDPPTTRIEMSLDYVSQALRAQTEFAKRGTTQEQVYALVVGQIQKRSGPITQVSYHSHEQLPTAELKFHYKQNGTSKSDSLKITKSGEITTGQRETILVLCQDILLKATRRSPDWNNTSNAKYMIEQYVIARR